MAAGDGVLSPPRRGIQTVTVAPGGAVFTEFKPEVPGNPEINDGKIGPVG